MEDILDLYERPLDPREPVVALDERPVQLLEHARPPRPARPGRPARRDYEYIRCGTANVFCGVEPKAGRHFLEATPDRKSPAFAVMLQRIASAYPRARRIHLVVDNLSTHTEKACVTTFGSRAGARLWRHFTVHYTPTHGSWLNQAEIEISLFSRQALGRDRIATLDALRRRTQAWEREANRLALKIRWGFTTARARAKFGYDLHTFRRSRD